MYRHGMRDENLKDRHASDGGAIRHRPLNTFSRGKYRLTRREFATHYAHYSLSQLDLHSTSAPLVNRFAMSTGWMDNDDPVIPIPLLKCSICHINILCLDGSINSNNLKKLSFIESMGHHGLTLAFDTCATPYMTDKKHTQMRQ